MDLQRGCCEMRERWQPASCGLAAAWWGAEVSDAAYTVSAGVLTSEPCNWAVDIVELHLFTCYTRTAPICEPDLRRVQSQCTVYKCQNMWQSQCVHQCSHLPRANFQITKALQQKRPIVRLLLSSILTSLFEFSVSASKCSSVFRMLFCSAMRAAGCCTAPRAVPTAAHHAQLSLHAHMWRCIESSSPRIVVQSTAGAAAALTQPASAVAPAAPTAAAQRALSIRCYSNAQASSSGSETSSGPTKLKYNLRPLNKGNKLTIADMLLRANKAWMRQPCRTLYHSKSYMISHACKHAVHGIVQALHN